MTVSAFVDTDPDMELRLEQGRSFRMGALFWLWSLFTHCLQGNSLRRRREFFPKNFVHDMGQIFSFRWLQRGGPIASQTLYRHWTES